LQIYTPLSEPELHRVAKAGGPLRYCVTVPILKRIQDICFLLAALGLLLTGINCPAQIDPTDRHLLEVGYDQALAGHGPQAIYAYYYFNSPEFFGPDVALRVAVAPAYLDSEIGFKHLLSPSTDVGIGVSGGIYGENYYEVRQGNFLESQSFYGDGGGGSVAVYQLLDPGMLIPLNLVARGGFHYSTFLDTAETSSEFKLPKDQVEAFTLFGLRFAGIQPTLYPDLALELSAWFERQWHFDDGTYGFDNDRSITPYTDLYWFYANLDYKLKQSGDRFSFATTVGGSTDADRFSAWRLGGVLPLISEFPLVLPGYYYEELTVARFVHFYGSYSIPLDQLHRWEFRVEAATARLDYLPGFEQRGDWQTGAGCAISLTPREKNFQIVLRCGYGFNAIRHDKEGAQSVGILFQYDFNARKKAH
jgi:hypothetical protein